MADGKLALNDTPAYRNVARRTAVCRSCDMCGGVLAAPGARTLDGVYELGDKLAEGGFSIVYRARDLALGRDVAVKVLRERFSRDDALVARFRRECRSLLQLRNDHVVATYDYGETSRGELFLVMELLAGETVDARCADRGPMSWTEVRDALRSVCVALAEAHAMGIVHRDLKPQNIHLGRDGVVKLIDFGLAKYPRGDELTRPGQVVGTLPYLSPEQLCGRGCDARSDVYALGVVGYEMLTGTLPYPNAWSAELLVTAMHTEVPPAPSDLRALGEIPGSIDAVVLRCIAGAPEARYASALEVAEALGRIVE